MNYPVCSVDNRHSFHSNGFLLIKNFFDPDLCIRVCSALDVLDHSFVDSVPLSRSTYIDTPDSFTSQYLGLTYLQKASLFIPELSSFKNLPLLAFSATLLGVRDAFFAEDEVHIRQPSFSHEIPAHQDNFYFALQRPCALTCYVYLSSQDRNSGGLGFLPSTTTLSTDDHDPSKTVGFSSYNKYIESTKKEDFVYPSTAPGDVVFHYSNTYHRAFHNSTPSATASVSIRVFSYANLDKSKSIFDKYTANLKANRCVE